MQGVLHQSIKSTNVVVHDVYFYWLGSKFVSERNDHIFKTVNAHEILGECDQNKT